jgi:outer membrane protein assembly factor BamB
VRFIYPLLGLGVAGAAMALAACAELPGSAMPDVPLWVHHPGGVFSVFLRRELTISADKSGEPYERGRPEIDVAHRRVFVGSSDHGLYALDAVTGATSWRFQTAGAVQSEPLYEPAKDVVYFGSDDGALYALRASDGKLLWRFDTAAEVTRQPVLHRGTLFVTNANDTLLAIEPATGKMKWYRHRTPAFGMEMSGYAGPAVHGDRVYAAFSDGVVMSYDVRDGTQRWYPVDLTAQVEQARTGEELRYLDVDTTPVITKSGKDWVVVVASYEGGVFALDADTGMQVWANEGATGITELVLWEWPARPKAQGIDLSAAPAGGGAEAPPERMAAGASDAGAGESGPAGAQANVAMHRVLVGSSGLSGLWGINPDDGKELWRRDVPSGGITAAAPVQGAVVVGTTRYGVFLVSPLDGGVIDGIHSGGAFAATPAARGTRAFLLSNEGVLFGLHVEAPSRPRSTSAPAWPELWPQTSQHGEPLQGG